jgi:ribosomal protein S12 methylthiotransferase accessory factor
VRLNRPAFKPHYVAVPVDEESVLLLSERKRILLRGRLIVQLTPLLDGARTIDDIVAALATSASESEVRDALASLEMKGYIGEACNMPRGEAAFWSIQDIEPSSARTRLETASVSLQALGDIDPTPFVAALNIAGIRVTAEGSQLAIIITDDYLRPELTAINDGMLESRKAWLIAKPVGTELWIGPLMRRGFAACWACLAARLRENREIESFAQSRLGGDAALKLPLGATDSSRAIAASLIAGEASRFLAARSLPSLENSLVSLDLLTLTSTAHTVVRRPQCAACGSADVASFSRAGLPITLSSNRATHTDGGQRTITPEATVACYRHLVSPITGWVSRLEKAPGGNDLMHVWFAGHNFARQPTDSIDALRTSLRSQSSGKGVSEAQAQASGLCEALERASGLFDGTEPRRSARISELPGAVHPNSLLLYSERQYRERDIGAGRRVPMPFDEDREIDWTPAWSLTSEEVRYLPTAFCYYRYPIAPDHQFVYACSNGCAAGNTLEEAILQGFFELVERDAVALWWYNRVPRPAVDLRAFADPWLDRHAEMLKTLGREMWLLDLTTDFGIPVYAAISRRFQGAEEILLGFGAHGDPRVAALRAATELNQMIAWTGAGDSRNRLAGSIPDSATARWLQTATVENQPYLAPLGVNTIAEPEPRWSDDLRENVIRCRDEVARHGLELIVLDQTRADIGLPVAKVVVPGLRHFWSRFAPGRLYDVPVQLGWLDRPLTEEELNPVELIL